MSSKFIVLLLAIVLALMALVVLIVWISSRRPLHCPRCKEGRLRMVRGGGFSRHSASFYVCDSCFIYLRRYEGEWSDLTELEQKCILADEARERMKRALNEVVASRLRERGFEDFRCGRPDRVDIFEFEISSPPCVAFRPVAADEEVKYTAILTQGLADAHRFRVVLTQSVVPCGGRAVSSDEERLWHLEHHNPGRVPRTSSWFSYKDAKTDEDFRRIAESVLPLLDRAEAMFDDFEHVGSLENGSCLNT